MEIVPGKLLRWRLYARGVAKYSDFGHVEGLFRKRCKISLWLRVQLTRRIEWYHFGPWVILIRVLGFQFWDTVYISEINGARKVKSDVQV